MPRRGSWGNYLLDKLIKLVVLKYSNCMPLNLIIVSVYGSEAPMYSYRKLQCPCDCLLMLCHAPYM